MQKRSRFIGLLFIDLFIVNCSHDCRAVPCGSAVGIGKIFTNEVAQIFQSLTRFLNHEATRSIFTTPPGWNASPSQPGIPSTKSLRVIQLLPEWVPYAAMYPAVNCGVQSHCNEHEVAICIPNLSRGDASPSQDIHHEETSSFTTSHRRTTNR